ncbi:hypothetical protein ENSA5_20820 [Enhygromyxa salina]|uniref:Uncharacterized protein n=1 Tax=Enhygromyxa salina TaxID=215803 RepID=A0A2S9YCI0_9BACT|nr:hypothetical protein ENSA5_20820 [Enhygromyxa salina]
MISWKGSVPGAVKPRGFDPLAEEGDRLRRPESSAQRLIQG